MRRTTLACLALTGLLVASVTGCRDDDGNNNNNNNTTGDNTIYQVQDPADPNHLQAGDLVIFEDVVVTAVDTYGERTGSIWVQEPNGGAYSGVLVFAPAVVNGSISDLSVGDVVTVRGEIDEFALTEDTSGRTTTEITNGSVERIGTGTPLVPEVVSVQAVVRDPTAEEWEGVLVTVNNVRATEVSSSYNEVTYTGGLVADDDLFDVVSVSTADTCYGSVTGVANYFFNYFVLPRSAADIVEAANDDSCDNAATEIECTDDQDNDGDGFTDCDDWDCEDTPGCTETDCDDNQDNDGDGDTDCDDQDCLGTVACPAPAENTNALCGDLQDNDGDNLIDCEDPSCHNHPDVTVCVETSCTDDVDNDGDGYKDCADRECWDDTACIESNCTDGTDDDGDGFTDCDDRDCWVAGVTCDATQEMGETECTDGSDNDGDGFTNCDDNSCQETYAGCVETNCTDGVDNDNDGHSDCTDFDCQFNDPVCGAQWEADPVSCSDGLDNDGDGFTDCSDFSCRCCPSEGCGGFEHVADTCAKCAE